MKLLTLAFPLVILALMGVAIYEHVTSITLSLPLAPALTFLTILLPFFGAGNILSLSYLARKTSRGPRDPLRPVGPIVLQVLQGVLTTVLATLYATDVVPGATRACELSTRWQHLFRTKDARSVRLIQEAFQCCGFRSVKDMAWPFPPTNLQCAARFDRSLACEGPWTQALQRSAGVNLGLVLAVGLLQILSIVLARRDTGQNAGFSWSDVSRLWSRQDDLGGSASRPLLTERESQVQEVEEEVGETGHRNERGYGALEGNRETGPRLEPSGLHHQEGNEWRED